MSRAAVRLWVLGVFCSVVWMVGVKRSSQADTAQEIHIDLQALRPGDVILRRGRDAVSAIVLASDQGSRFSHAGVIVQAGKLLGVVHVLPAEPAHPNGTAIAEAVPSFASPEEASEVAVFRLSASGTETPREAARIALRYVREKRRFDDRFSLATPTELYCSELVWRAFLEAGLDLVDGHFRRLSLPVSSGDYVLPSSLANSPHLEMILDWKKEE